jgi:hypothetical protein
MVVPDTLTFNEKMYLFAEPGGKIHVKLTKEIASFVFAGVACVGKMRLKQYKTPAKDEDTILLWKAWDGKRKITRPSIFILYLGVSVPEILYLTT